LSRGSSPAGYPAGPLVSYRINRQLIEWFACGGAFTGLEKIISARSRPCSIGFGAKVMAPEDRNQGDGGGLWARR